MKETARRAGLFLWVGGKRLIRGNVSMNIDCEAVRE